MAKAKPQASKGLKTTAAPPKGKAGVDIFGGRRPATCLLCKQQTSSYDKDARPSLVLLKWHRTKKDKDGELFPYGSECYWCYTTRRRFFTESLEELCPVLETTLTANTNFMKFRRDKVTGKNEFAGEEPWALG